MRIQFFLLGVAVIVLQASAGAMPFEGRTVSDIRFSPLQPLDAADLSRALAVKKGEPLSAAAVAKSIDGLFATGRFQDIAVEVKESGDGVIVRFATELTFFLGHTALEGKLKTPPSRAQILAAGQFTVGTPFRDADVTAAVKSIEHLLESNGFYHPEVMPDVQRDTATQQVFLTFRVKEPKRAKYEAPVFQGETRLPDSTIIRATGWRVPIVHWWRTVTEARTSGGVRGILTKYEKQDRLTAKAEIQKLDYDESANRVRPTLNIAPGPKVKVTAVETKISKRILRRYVPVFEDHSVDNDLLVEGKRNLQDYLQSQGYYDVEVDFRIRPTENDLETIEYVISRGTRFKLVHLTIRGNHYFRTEDIQERLFMATASKLTLRHGRYSEAFRRKDEENITDLYHANGFRDVRVNTTVDRNYQDKAGQVAVTVDIAEGPQWIVDHLTVSGVQQVEEHELTSELAGSEGEPFTDANLASDRGYVLTYYYERGFPSASFKATWQPNGTAHHVDVAYTIQEGERQYVRDILITGLRTTRRSLVERTIGIQQGEPLSPVAAWEAQKRLYDLGVFARVDTAIQNPDGDTQHKNVVYSFEEANRYRLTLGVGATVGSFGTPSTTNVSSPAGQTGFSPEFSMDLSRLDFLGLGHTVSLRGVYSTLERRASISYLQPRLLDRQGLDLTYALLYDNSLNVRTFASRREEASVQLSDKFSKSLTGLLKFAYRRVSVSSVVIPTLLVPQLLQPVRIGMLSANLAQDRRDNVSNPQRGMYNTADVGLATSYFGSQRSFARILLRNATYHRIGQHLVLARQTRFGVIKPFSTPTSVPGAESVPLPERFFGGGADSLRAFPFNQAGPRDIGAPLVPGGPASAPTGFPLGGNALLFNNVELRFPLAGPNIQGVLFYDLGNVYRSVSDISFRFHQRDLTDFNYTVHAPGIGLRYQTPVGPIRVDLAYSINPPSFLGFSGTPQQLLQCNPNLPPSALPGYCQSTKQSAGHLQFFFSIGQTF
jgi:outer membrane protein assembly complex protein YaeT